MRFMEYNELFMLGDLDQYLLEAFFESLQTPYERQEGEPNYREWMAQDKQGERYKPNTIHNWYRPINTMVRYYQKSNVLPTFLYEHPKADHKSALPAPSEEEFDRCLASCLNRRDFVLLLFIGDTGLRHEETTRVIWKDIEMRRMELFVPRGKGNKARGLALSAFIVSELEAYRQILPEDRRELDRPVFPSKFGGRLTRHSLQSILKRIEQRAGVKISAHALRRFAIRAWRRAGRALSDGMDAAGHETEKTHRHYLGRLGSNISPAQHDTTAIQYLVKNNLLKNIRFRGTRK